MLSFSKLRVKDPDVCKSCKTKDCISSKNHYSFNARSCTSELFPLKLSDNKDCILCGQCFKSCTKDNIVIKKRRFAEDLFSTMNLKWAEIAFFIIISGFVVYEILSEWKVSKEIVMAAPHWINNSLNITGKFAGTIKAIILFFVLPTIFYTVFAMAKKQFAGENWKRSFTQLVMVILPITASMHLLKALLKTTSRIPYWKFVAGDPKGVNTATEIMQKPELLHSSFLSGTISPLISLFAVILPIFGLLLSLYVVKKQTHTNTTSRIISVFAVVVYAGIFIISMLEWRLL
jgi:NAD-dependent dihydropyrimidine dehydrogenase PreA subunit